MLYGAMRCWEEGGGGTTLCAPLSLFDTPRLAMDSTMEVDKPDTKPTPGPSEPSKLALPANGSTDVEMKDDLPEGASQVLYINNLNEKIKIDGKLTPRLPGSHRLEGAGTLLLKHARSSCSLVPAHLADCDCATVLKQSLKTLFKQYGPVLDIVAHRSIRMRGQAFVTMESKVAASKAVQEVKGFPLYGKPMVSSL
jgi:RNA recognition motif-containing protein